MYGCQQVLIHCDSSTNAILEFICSESNKLSNCAIYYARQIWFKAHRYITKFELDREMKSNRHFQVLYSQASQQACRSVFEAFKSFRELNAAYKRGEIVDKPKPPKYRKDGFNLVTYPKQALKLINNQIRIPLGNQVNKKGRGQEAEGRREFCFLPSARDQRE